MSGGDSYDNVVPCRSCMAPVRWREHHRTHRIAPIDAEPVSAGAGDLVLLVGGRYAVGPTTVPAEEIERRGEDGAPLRFASHYQTCPEAQAWRSKARRR